MADVDDGWLAEQEALERAPEGALQVDPQPRRWHAVVLTLRNQLIKAVARVKAAQKSAQRTRRTGRTRALESAEWQWFVRRGGLLVPPHKPFPLRVTPASYERALAILNTVCFAAEARGFFVSLNDAESRVLLSGHGGEVEVRMAERLDRKFSLQRRPDTRLERRRELTPTGTLRLFVCASGGSETLFGDLPDQPLESVLNAVFVRVYRQVVRCREARREREALARRQAREPRACDTSWHSEEQCRRKELLNEVRRWQDAELIRAYVARLLEKTPHMADQEPWTEWRRWALQVADELDPTVNTPER